jgi:hypothetical protein
MCTWHIRFACVRLHTRKPHTHKTHSCIYTNTHTIVHAQKYTYTQHTQAHHLNGYMHTNTPYTQAYAHTMHNELYTQMVVAFAHAPVSVVQPVSAMGLVVLLVFSHFYLAERLRPAEWVAAALAGACVCVCVCVCVPLAFAGQQLSSSSKQAY